MPKCVLLDKQVHSAGAEILEKEVELCELSEYSPEALKAAIEDVRGIIVSSVPKITADVLGAARALQVLGRYGIGLDSVDVGTATALGIPVVYTPYGPTESVAEHTVGLLIALARHIRLADQAARAGRFQNRRDFTGVELKGKVLGLIGLGRIGSRVAEICGGAMYMKVIAYDPFVAEDDARAMGVELRSSLLDVMRVADFVSIHTPLSPQTRGLIGAAELGVMKPSAYLVNTSRGPVLDEDALVEALSQERIAGAALDVYAQEPPPDNHPLFELSNVILTPHIGSFTEDSLRRMAVMVAEDTLRVLRGERPLYLANPAVWEDRRTL
jgi:D-3-phosphoglycerate dehydrogenase